MNAAELCPEHKQAITRLQEERTPAAGMFELCACVRVHVRVTSAMQDMVMAGRVVQQLGFGKRSICRLHFSSAPRHLPSTAMVII
jgi:hypothetical protein